MKLQHEVPNLESPGGWGLWGEGSKPPTPSPPAPEALPGAGSCFSPDFPIGAGGPRGRASPPGFPGFPHTRA